MRWPDFSGHPPLIRFNRTNDNARVPSTGNEVISNHATPSSEEEFRARRGSQRQLRVGEQVRHAMAEILAQGNVHDADLEGHIITVPEVRMSPDLKLATV